MLERIDSPDTDTRTIHLTLTCKCNMKCTYCVSKADLAEDHELTTREWTDIIDQLTESYGPVPFIVKGGEPMLRDDFFPLLSHIKSRGHHITLITNAVLIRDEKTARELAQYVDQMEVSLDGISEETTAPIKGEGMFQAIMNGVAQVRKTRIKLGLSFVILEQNQSILWSPLEAFLREIGEDTVAVRIDNRLTFPVSLRCRQGDFFDFLRNTDKLACHGQRGRHPARGELEVDAAGMLHPFCPAASGQREVRTV